MNKYPLIILLPLILLLVNIPAVLPGQTTFFGDYEGIFTQSTHANCVAEVIPVGNDEYVLHIMERFNIRAEKLAIARGKMENGAVRFDNDILRAVIANDSLKGELFYINRWRGFKLAKVERFSPTTGAMPTDKAIILFDGKGFDEWTGEGDQPVEWTIINENEAEVVPSGPYSKPMGNIFTKREFTSLFLHLEFKLSLMEEKTGQQRSNSGVIFDGLKDHLEIQILDSYGLEGNWVECGSLYKRSPPKVNMCAPPLVWQTYDIIYHSPVYDANGSRIKNGEITVFHNGNRIHYKYPINREPDVLDNGQTELPVRIRLQDHRDVLWFRNIWAVDLSLYPDGIPEYFKKLEL